MGPTSLRYRKLRNRIADRLRRPERDPGARHPQQLPRPAARAAWSALLASCRSSTRATTRTPARPAVRDAGHPADRARRVGGPGRRPLRDRVATAASSACRPPSGVPALDQPGFKVIHIQDIDFETTCFTLRRVPDDRQGVVRRAPAATCRSRSWSRRRTTRRPTPQRGLRVPGADRSRAVRRARRGDPLRLPAREADHARRRPPRLPDARGRRARARLADARRGARQGHLHCSTTAATTARLPRRTPVARRAASSSRAPTPGNADAAFIKLNDPSHPPTSRTRVAAGYVVRTRADADTEEARANDTTTRDAALASGAQWVSTDYPVPNPTQFMGYFARDPGRDAGAVQSGECAGGVSGGRAGAGPQ